jgi:CubicO group peptidase (beta-lactamase class C family)
VCDVQRLSARASATLVSLLLLLATSRLDAQKPDGFDEAWSGVATLFQELCASEGVVGASLWFFRGEEELGRVFHGYADLASKRPVDAQTIWHWASNTKTLTGIAIMQLRDRGRLNLDDPVVRHVPELREVHNPYGPVEDVTLRHLLSHSAGFRASTWPWGGDEDWHPYEPTRWAQLVAMMPYTEVMFEPGSRFSYSNPGILFLGKVIERFSGDDWEVYVDKNILRPLGMQRSYFDITPYHLIGYRSNNYRIEDGRPVANGLDFDTGITVSNGGLNAPVPDIARYIAFLSGARPMDVVLARASLEEMWRPVVRAAEAPAGGQESVGLTFFISEWPNLRLVGHTGSQRAFQSFFYVDPETGAASIGVFNTDAGSRGRPHTREIIDRIRGMLVKEVFPRFHEGG